MERKKFVITGDRGKGKTSFCQVLIELARNKQWRITGVLSPPVFEGGNKIGIDVIDLSTQEVRRLANTVEKGSAGPKTIRWAFDGEVLSWGNDVLGDITSCDLLLIDELGPLEFERNEGWLNGIKAFTEADYKVGMVVIRPELVEQAITKWPNAEIIEIENPKQASILANAFFDSFLNLDDYP